MQGTTEKGIQILKKDTDGNLRPNNGIAVAQRITIEQEKGMLQKAYTKDTRAKELRKQKGQDNNIQEKEGVFYWKG